MDISTKMYMSVWYILYSGLRQILAYTVGCQLLIQIETRRDSPALPAQYADSVDLKGGLMNSRVCTVKFRVVESYFSS